MVISVFNTAPGFQAYEGSRRARLQDQALRTEQEAMARRQAAFNNMLGQIEDPQQRSMLEAMGVQGAPAFYEMQQRQQAAEAERQQEEQAARLEFLQNEGQRFAEARLAGGDEFDESAFLRGSVMRASDSGIAVQDPELLQGRVRTWGAGYTPDANNEQSTEFERLISTLPPEDQAAIRRNRAEYLAGMTNRPSASSGPGLRISYDDQGRAVVEYGYDDAAQPGQGTRGAGLGPQTRGEADRRSAALDESNVRAGPVDEYFRLTGRLTEAGSGGAGVGARLIQATGAQIGGGVSLAEYLVTGDAQLGPDIINRGNEILQEVTGLDAADTARLRSNQILVRSKLLPLVAGGLGQRYTDFENELAGQVLGDVNDPAASFETMQGNRSAVYAALAVQDARAAIAADATPSYNVVTPAGQPNPEGAREMMRVLQQDYGFSEDEAYGIYEGYARSLIQLYQRPRRQLIEDVEAIRSAQEELANQ